MKGVFFQAGELQAVRRRRGVVSRSAKTLCDYEFLIFSYLSWSEALLYLSLTSKTNHQRVQLYLNELPTMFAHMGTIAFLWKCTDLPLLTRQYLCSYYFQRVFYPNHPELHDNTKLLAHLAQLCMLIERLNARRDLYSTSLIGYLENQLRYGRLAPEIYNNLADESPENCIPAGINFKLFNRASRMIWASFCDEAKLKDLTDEQWAVLHLGVKLEDIKTFEPSQCRQFLQDWGRQPLGLIKSSEQAHLLKLDIEQKNLIKQLRRTY